MRTIITALVCVAGAILVPPQAAALDYPTKPVHVIVPFTAGGAPDVLMRLLGQKLAEKWGQGVVIENRAGGNTLIGTVAGAKSPPDGYTLTLAADQTFVLNPLLYSSLPYSMKEFDPIILMASIPHMLAVANKVPVTNVKELIALAKAKPDTITFGTTGPGTIQRIATEYFAGIAGVKLVHVPYKGANETTIAILSRRDRHDHQRHVEHPAAYRRGQAEGAGGLDRDTQSARARRPDHAGGRRARLQLAGRVRPVRARPARRRTSLRKSIPTPPRCWRSRM